MVTDRSSIYPSEDLLLLILLRLLDDLNFVEIEVESAFAFIVVEVAEDPVFERANSVLPRIEQFYQLSVAAFAKMPGFSWRSLA